MATVPHRSGLNWSAKLLIALALMLAGAAAAAWALARYDGAARFFGVVPDPQRPHVSSPNPLVPIRPPTSLQQRQTPQPMQDQRIAELEARLGRVEGAAQRVEGAAGRADALLIAFAARRAMERGIPLGYLEPLLLDRFGASHPRAVATIITASHSPVRLSELVAEYRDLGPILRSSAQEDGWWTQFKRELGSIVQVRRADRPSTQPDARYLRALSLLTEGEADSALAETMRLPGAARAGPWIRKARQYVAVQRALDSIEAAALMGTSATPAA